MCWIRKQVRAVGGRWPKCMLNAEKVTIGEGQVTKILSMAKLWPDSSESSSRLSLESTCLRKLKAVKKKGTVCSSHHRRVGTVSSLCGKTESQV